MNVVLVKILATALTLSQVTTAPESIKTEFDPVVDQPRVARLLQDGCGHMRKAFDIEDINLDDLIATAMDDPQALTGEITVLKGLDLRDVHAAYRQFCKGETVAQSPVDLREVITYFNQAVKDLPDHTTLKGRPLPGMSVVLDGRGARFTEVFEPDHRRIWIPLAEIPDPVRRAFIAAEDKRFAQHRGIDERGVIRAFIENLADPGRPQGGSTITQQVAKNLLVGDDITYDRKMREMIVASRLERTLTKDEILEIYLNSIFLGRSSWGIELAARSFFGKSAKDLTAAEGALLAALTKGPNYYDPDRRPDRARERYAYVLNRMREDGAIDAATMAALVKDLPPRVAFVRLRRDSGFHFVDHLAREARTLARLDGGLTGASYTVRSTILPDLQRATETALQEGLFRHELNTGRLRLDKPEANLAEAIAKLAALPAEADAGPAWRRALAAARLPLYDVHWTPAVVVEKSQTRKGGEVIKVGLPDGRVVALNAWTAGLRRSLALHDVVRVRIAESKGKAPRAELRVPPSVQGAVLVLENQTGKILAMTGGFSYPQSQLNRVTQAHRQPGSAVKPLTYLAALGRGLQPNTLMFDAPVTLPPAGGSGRAQDYWTPKNYDGGSGGMITLRRALENSKNLVTARLLDGVIAGDASSSLSRVCDLALEAQLYVECIPHYPFVLGAQALRMIDLATFYAAVANEGRRPTPYALEAVEKQGATVYRREPRPLAAIGSADAVAFHQLKTILQGVLERGTARSMKRLAPYVGGKTGTTDDENDAWFVGFTNDVTIAVWVGYDNAETRKTLGRGQTGGKVAAPIFERVVEAAWAHHRPRTALAPASPETAARIARLPINIRTGDRIVGGQQPGDFREYFRLDGAGQLAETQFDFVPREDAWAMREPDVWSDGEQAGGWGDPFFQEPFARAPAQQAEPWQDDTFAPPWWEEDRSRRRPRRVDPDYRWGGQVY